MKPVTPLLTVDSVIRNPETGGIVLIKRKFAPYQGHYALPGGFVDVGETVEDACRREAKEETNLTLTDIVLIGVYSDPKRDPRGHSVTVAYYAENDLADLKAGDDAAEAEIVTNWRDLEIGFDHAQILREAALKFGF